jgi:hypothetical protein
VKRLVVLALGLVTFLVSTVAFAGTATTLGGTAEWSGGTVGVPTTTVIRGTFDGKVGKGTYEGTLTGGTAFTTAECGPVCEPVAGTITFSSSRGSFTGVVQPGSVVALQDIASHSWRTFTLTLGVENGTRGYAHANGALTLSYTSTWSHYYDAEALAFVDTVTDSGTLAGDLH